MATTTHRRTQRAAPERPADAQTLTNATLAFPDATDEDTSVALPESGATYTVRLPGFNGPLDLLLHLIERNQLEITTISLVAVTDQFVAYLRAWDEPPLPRLAAFVAMAARLLLIKSRSLLPRLARQDESADESDPLEDAEQLRQHLIEYKLAREIARALRARELAGLHSFARAQRLVDPEATLTLAPPKLVGLNVNALALVFRRVLLAQRFATPEDLPPPVVTVADKMAEIEALLAVRGRITLEEALLTADSRFAVVVTFLAALEMWHQARLIIEQEELFGPVVILPGPRAGQRPPGDADDPGTASETAPASEFDPTLPESAPPKTRGRRRAKEDKQPEVTQPSLL
ncbi:MAG TPA: ScpA family protein [Ktedonobacterales bacterium]|nr:ScpA family protein [Ktedonobacterales bacterium]